MDELKKTTKEEHQAFINSMKGYLEDEKPKVGIFWYDFINNCLFGIEKVNADMAVEVNGKATISKLHKTYWQKQHQRALAANHTQSIFYREQNYTMIPRGRVFLINNQFIVTVGSWIDGDINGEKCVDAHKLRLLLVDEFNLPDDFNFVIDSHWDIGHGWAEELV